MSRKKLTKAAVERMKPRDKRVEVPDAYCPGLYLIVQPTGRKVWAFRYRLYGKPQKLTIGAYPYYDLEGAREEGKAIGQEISKGQDPKLNRALPQQLRRRTPETYREAVEDYYTRFQLAKRDAKTAHEIRRTLLKEGGLSVQGRGDAKRERVVHPRWIDRPLRDLDARMIQHRLEEIRDGTDTEKARPYLANRFYSYLKRFFEWAAQPGQGKIDGSPMAGLSKPWDGEAPRERYFTDGELVAIWHACETLPPAMGAFVRVAMLTGKRKSALASMKWLELRPNNTWVPSQNVRNRSANKRADVTVLPELAIQVIQSVPIEDRPLIDGEDGSEVLNEYVFKGRKSGRPLDPGSWLADYVKEASGVDDFYMHALRHTVETGLASLKVQPHIRDMLLDHSTQRGSGQRYDHYEYIAELREAVEIWSAHIQRKLKTVPLEDTPLAKKKEPADG